MKRFIGSFLLVIFVIIECTNALPNHNNNAQLINDINHFQSEWEAEENRFTHLDDVELKRWLGLKFKTVEEKQNEFKHDIEVPSDIPDTFDAREQWPQCESIASIKDQSNCGSCWAVSSTSAMSDRLCIASNFEKRVNISAEALMTCCGICTNYDPGCEGGVLTEAWKYWHTHGLVTGGDYGSNEGCQPYAIKPCDTCKEEADTPLCRKNRCTNKKYSTPYNKDLIQGKSYYAIPKDVAKIQAEIMKNGPLTTGFKVYKDFFSYKTGVYRYIKGKFVGNHAVRVIGWGFDSTVNLPYWLVANSWNRSWGDKGLFRIVRGSNECGFEENVYAGLPN